MENEFYDAMETTIQKMEKISEDVDVEMDSIPHNLPASNNKFNIASNDYKKYKKDILGDKVKPDREDMKCDFYLITGYRNVKNFVSKIKSFAMNYQTNDEHIKHITRQIRNEDEIYFTNPIALVEYVNYEVEDIHSLIEIIDGHHRIESLKNILQSNRNISIEIWIQIYKVTKPDDPETIILFKKYNNVKPFPCIKSIIDVKILLVDKINNIFINVAIPGYRFIKDSTTSIYRPSVKKDEICKCIETQIKKEMDISNCDLADIDYDKIILRFVIFNRTLLEKPIQWFNDKKQDYYYGTILSEATYNKAREVECMIGLVKLQYLINHCLHF